MAAIIGRKIGMTRYFSEDGVNVPVTLVAAGPCNVSQLKTLENDGYTAIQLAFEKVKGRNTTIPKMGHDAKAGLEPHRIHREFRVKEDKLSEYELGSEVNVSSFESVKFVDVTGTSKGNGFAGVMKRHGFKGQLASHGVERKHRSPGSVGGRGAWLGGGRPKKGGRKSGQDGNVRVTSRSVEVLKIDTEKNILVLKGALPGANQGLLYIQDAGRLYKSKAARV